MDDKQSPEPVDLSDPELVERLIDELLGSYPRAAQWRQWREALEERLQKLLELKAKGIVGFPDLDERIEELHRYIAVLHEEELLTDFLEQQVRMVLGKARWRKALEGDEG